MSLIRIVDTKGNIHYYSSNATIVGADYHFRRQLLDAAIREEVKKNLYGEGFLHYRQYKWKYQKRNEHNEWYDIQKEEYDAAWTAYQDQFEQIVATSVDKLMDDHQPGMLYFQVLVADTKHKFYARDEAVSVL